MLEEIQEEAKVTPDSIKKKFRALILSKTLDPENLSNYFQLSASSFLTVTKKNESDDGELYERYFREHFPRF